MPHFFFVSAVISGIVAWSVYAGLALWNRWEGAPKLAQRYYVGSLIVMLLGTIVGIVAGVLLPTLAFSQFPGAIIGVVIGVSYLQKSKRVAATFGRTDKGPIDHTKATFAAVAAAALFLLASSVIYQSEDWVEHKSAAGGYRVTGLRPLRVEREQSGEQTAMFGNDYRGFIVKDFALGPEAQTDHVLEGLKQHVLSGLKAVSVSSSSSMLNGHPALHFTAAYSEQGVYGEAIAKAVVADGHAYLVVATGNAGGRIRQDAEKFFSSFRLERPGAVDRRRW